MLLRFAVSNHRSIHQLAELSMIAVDEDRPAARSFELLNERVLTVAGIYGPNASGKSNVLDAVAWLADAVFGSLRSWEERIPRDPFKFGAAATEPTHFDVEAMVNGVRHAYSLVLDDKHVLYEGLFSYPERRRRLLFEREDLDIGFRRGLGGIAGTRELLTPTTLALSAARRFDEPEIRSFSQALTGVATLGFRRHRRDVAPRLQISTAQLFYESIERGAFSPREEEIEADAAFGPDAALALLQVADMGIHDYEIVEEGTRGGSAETSLKRYIRLVHRTADQELSFSMSDESEGTWTWFQLIGPVLNALRLGQTVLFDEIDASLHPRLSAILIELFQDPATNPRGAQLIFTSHDTSLLNQLNRDEVWLTEKDDHGGTTLTALAEFGGDKVRRSLNLERAYLQGRFGGVPEVDHALLNSTLGATGGSR